MIHHCASKVKCALHSAGDTFAHGIEPSSGLSCEENPAFSVVNGTARLNEKLNPPAMLGRLEEDVSGMRK